MKPVTPSSRLWKRLSSFSFHVATSSSCVKHQPDKFVHMTFFLHPFRLTAQAVDFNSIAGDIELRQLSQDADDKSDLTHSSEFNTTAATNKPLPPPFPPPADCNASEIGSYLHCDDPSSEVGQPADCSELGTTVLFFPTGQGRNWGEGHGKVRVTVGIKVRVRVTVGVRVWVGVEAGFLFSRTGL